MIQILTNDEKLVVQTLLQGWVWTSDCEWCFGSNFDDYNLCISLSKKGIITHDPIFDTFYMSDGQIFEYRSLMLCSMIRYKIYFTKEGAVDFNLKDILILKLGGKLK